jgi:SEC-C motif
MHEGGQIRFGWSIWEWPGVFVEAEHHAVYEPPSGPPFLDITPSAHQGIWRRLFLLDDSATYDSSNEGVLRHNIRRALSDDPLIQKFFAAATKRATILNDIPGVNVKVEDVNPQILKKVEAAADEQDKLYFALAMKYTPQNAPCFCGSGQKLKRCHGAS